MLIFNTAARSFLARHLETTDARSLWYPSYLGFLVILNALSGNILSEAVFLAKSLRSP